MLKKSGTRFVLLVFVMLAAVLLLRLPGGAPARAAHLLTSFTTPYNISNSGNPGVGENASQHARAVIAADSFLHATWMEGTLNSANGPAYTRGQGTSWAAWQWAGPNDNPAFTNPTIALDSSGTVHLVWTARAGGYYRIFYAYKPSGGTWSAMQVLSQNDSQCFYPSIGIDSQDQLWVAWEQQITEQDFDVYVRSKPAGGSWGATVNVSNKTGKDLEPALVVDADDVPHVVWRNNDWGWEIYHTRYVGGAWTAPLNLSSNGSASHYPRIAADSQGNVFVVWEDEIDGQDRLQALFRRWDGIQWGSTRRVSATPTKALYPAISADDHCNLYAVWTDYRNTSTETYFSYSTNCGDTWSMDENVSGNASSSFYPDVVAQDAGRAHIFWQDYAPGQFDVYYSMGTAIVPTPTPTGPTSTPTPVPTATAPPTPTDTPTPTPRPNFAVSGQVLDANGNPIADVNISAGAGYQATTDAAGLYALTDLPAGTYNLSASRPNYTFSPSLRVVTGPPDAVGYDFTGIGPLPGRPVVRSVRSCVRGPYFLSGCSLPNRLDVEIDWQDGTPGTVDFVLNGVTSQEAASGNTASHTYDMCSDLVYSLPGERNQLMVVATSAEGVRSSPYVVALLGVETPSWVSLPLVVEAGCGQGAAKLGSDLLFPELPLEGLVLPPAEFPYLGGWPFGVSSTQALLQLELATSGVGRAALAGEMSFEALGQEAVGQTRGGGGLDMHEGTGVRLSDGLWNLELAGRLGGPAPLMDVLPSMQDRESWPIVGGVVRWFGRQADLAGQVEPMVDARSYFSADASALGWESLSGSAGARMMLALRLKLVGRMNACVYGGGQSSLLLQVPPDPACLSQASLRFFAGAKLRNWGLENTFGDAFAWSYAASVGQQAATPRRISQRDAGGWRPVGRGYMADPYTVFVAEPIPPRMVPAGTSETMIASNVYPYAEPALAVSDTRAMLLWAHDDGSKPPLQGEEILYTRYDGTDWSPPAALTDDYREDFSPQVAYDAAGQVVAVWERMRAPKDLSATLDLTYTRDLEIAYAIWDGITWTIPLTLTDNGVMDHAPLLAAGRDGQLMLLWRQNPAGELVGSAAAPDTLYSSIWDGFSWSGPLALPITDSLAPSLACYSHTRAALVYTRDLDGDLTSPNDQELYAATWDGSSWSDPARLTDDDRPDNAPLVLYDAAGTVRLLWLKGDTLYSLHGSLVGEGTAVLTENSAALLDFRAALDPAGNLALFWQGLSETGVDLYYTVYDASEGRFGRPLQLTDDSFLEAMPAPVFTSNQLWMTLLKDELLADTITVSPTLVVSNVTVLGQSDLYLLTHTLGPDLALAPADITFSPGNPEPGRLAQISATVHNRGDLAVPAAQVAVYQGDPLAGGVLLLTDTLDLAGGMSETVAVPWNVPVTATTQQIHILVDPADVVGEWDEGNNHAFVHAVLPDLVMPSAWEEYGVGDSITLTSVISNGGVAAAGPFTVTFRLADPLTGSLVAASVIPGLAVGQSEPVQAVWDASAVPDGWHVVYALANPAGRLPEADGENNTSWIGVGLLPDLVIQADEVAAAFVENGVMLIIPVSNEGARAASDAVLGLYGLWPQPGDVPAVQSTVDVPAGGSTVETLTWAGEWSPGIYMGANIDGILAERDLSNNLALFGRTPARVYLPLALRAPTPTPTPTATPAPTATPTPSPTATPAPWQTILFEGFEGDFPGPWRLYGVSGYSWGKRDCQVYAGNYSGWAVGGGSSGASLACGSNYPDSAQPWMVYGPFSLAGASDAEVVFQLWTRTESLDQFCWMASVDDHYYYGRCMGGYDPSWTEKEFDLTNVPTLGSLLGYPNVWIAFLFDADEAYNQPEGVYVDDILIRKHVGTQAVPAAVPQGGGGAGTEEWVVEGLVRP